MSAQLQELQVKLAETTQTLVAIERQLMPLQEQKEGLIKAYDQLQAMIAGYQLGTQAVAQEPETE